MGALFSLCCPKKSEREAPLLENTEGGRQPCCAPSVVAPPTHSGSPSVVLSTDQTNPEPIEKVENSSNVEPVAQEVETSAVEIEEKVGDVNEVSVIEGPASVAQPESFEATVPLINVLEGGSSHVVIEQTPESEQQKEVIDVDVAPIETTLEQAPSIVESSGNDETKEGEEDAVIENAGSQLLGNLSDASNKSKSKSKRKKSKSKGKGKSKKSTA